MDEPQELIKIPLRPSHVNALLKDADKTLREQSQFFHIHGMKERGERYADEYAALSRFLLSGCRGQGVLLYVEEQTPQPEEKNVQTVRLMPTEERILGLLKTINDEIDRDARTCFCKGRDSWIKIHREDYNALASALDSDKRVEWIMRIYDVPQSEDSLEEASKSSS